MTGPHPPRHTPILPLDETALGTAADRLEAWLAFAETNRPGHDHLRDVGYENYPISDADLEILLLDFRHHRPTQWAYDRACEALEKHRQRADQAEAERDRLATEHRLMKTLLEINEPGWCGRSRNHPPHKYLTARVTQSCTGRGPYALPRETEPAIGTEYGFENMDRGGEGPMMVGRTPADILAVMRHQRETFTEATYALRRRLVGPWETASEDPFGITPEDEGIATADVHAQQQADARAYCPDCGHPETNCACG